MTLATRLARVPPFERGLTLGDFLVPIRLGERAAAWQRHLLMILAGVALITLTAQLPGPVPFGVLFGSALLGFRRSLLTIALYLILGMVGLPVFAGWSSGLGQILALGGGTVALAPSGGYLVGFLFAGGLVGRLAELGWDRRLSGSITAMLLGNVVIYVFGVPWLMTATKVDLVTGLDDGLYPFLIGDAIKLALAAVLLPAGWWLVKRRDPDR